MRILGRNFAVAVVACGLAASVGTSQIKGTIAPSGMPTTPDATPPMSGGNDPAIRQIEQRQMRQRNDERQKRLVADTDKLLALATELHADVARTDKNVLSLDVIRRADEIERLAHSVKDRMRE